VTEPGIDRPEVTLRWGRYHTEERDQETRDGKIRKQEAYCGDQEEHTVTLDLRDPRKSVEVASRGPGAATSILSTHAR
jgi:hypothetical protein